MTHRQRTPTVMDNPVFRRMPVINPGDAPGSVPSASQAAGVRAVHSAARVYESTFILNNVVATVTDNGVNGGQASVQLLDAPEGLVRLLGASCSLALVAGAGIGATGPVVCAVGTVAAASTDATLTNTEANVIPSTSVTLTAQAGTFAGKSTATEGAIVLDGTATPVDFFVNFAVADANITVGTTITVNGTVTIVWAALGDN